MNSKKNDTNYRSQDYAVRQNHDMLDIIKYLSAFLVVFTHVRAFHESMPLGIAVSRFTIPLYYMASGYFFFRRVGKDPENAGWRKECLLIFIRRLLKLYFSWLLVQAPFMYLWGGWYAFGYEDGGSAAKTAFLLIKNFLLNSTFPASWYLMALMIGMILTECLARYVGNGVLLLFGLSCFAVCCANSGYLNLLKQPILLFYPPTSFLSSVIWLTVGKMTAEDATIILRFRRAKTEKKVLFLSVAVVLFFAEYFLCLKKGWAGNTDALLSLIPVCPMIFLTVLDIGKSVPHAKAMRAANTVIYCSHGMMLALLSYLGLKAGIQFETMPEAVSWYLLTLFLCNLLAYGMMRLQRKDGFHWLSCFW